eukprot:COSAG01_NODE_22808_length_840_cov_1.585695_1_plen_38_part_10
MSIDVYLAQPDCDTRVHVCHNPAIEIAEYASVTHHRER